MEDKKINKSLRRKFSPLGWIVILYYGIMNLLVMLVMFAAMAGQYLRGYAAGDYGIVPDVGALMDNGWGYILSIAVGATVLWAWKGNDFFREEVFHREKPMKAGAFFALLLLTLGAQSLNDIWVTGLEAVMNRFGRSLTGQLEVVSGDVSSVSMLLYMSILGPVAEELLFRGLALRTLRSYGKRFAIFASALLFALFHGNLLQIPFAFLMGLIMGYAAAEYSILWAIAIHVANNLGIVVLLNKALALVSEGINAMVSNGLFLAGLVGTIVLLAMKRQEVAAYRRSEWMDRRCLKCFFTCSGTIAALIVMGFFTVMMLITG